MTLDDFVRRGAAAQRAVNEILDDRTADDHAAAQAIMAAVDDADELVQRIYAYYQDANRAERTPRHTLYLHMGLLAGAYMRATKGGQ